MMKYIEDPDLYKAVQFASSMIKEGSAKGLAIYKAASYYDVATKDVASHLGKRGAEVANMNRRNRESYS
jgi:hypothetical protein